MTNNEKKLISSLATVKGRHRAGLFMVEGTKAVLDTMAAFSLHQLLATEQWLEAHGAELPIDCPAQQVSRGELCQVSALALTSDVIAIYHLPHPAAPDLDNLTGQLVLAVDCIQDPGNLGTIIRTADWMGIETILASNDTVDCFSPKVIQSTMGAIARVKVHYGCLPEMLRSLSHLGMDIYGTMLNGDNIYTARLGNVGVVVMGNEGHGLSQPVIDCLTKRLLIPSYPPERPTSESLNVASATAIVLSQFISRNYGKG